MCLTPRACDRITSPYPHAWQAADEYVRKFGLTLKRVTKDFNGPGGLELQLLQRAAFAAASFVVQLRVTYDNLDRAPDLHCVAYDGFCIKDNHKYTKVKLLEASDRASKDAARAVFSSLFPGLKVQVSNVYALQSVF